MTKNNAKVEPSPEYGKISVLQAKISDLYGKVAHQAEKLDSQVKEDISLSDLKTIIGILTGSLKEPTEEQLNLVTKYKDSRITLEQATLVADAISSERSAVASSVLKQVVEALALHRELFAKLGITDEDVDAVSGVNDSSKPKTKSKSKKYNKK